MLYLRFPVFFILFFLAPEIFAQGLKEVYIACDPEEFSYVYENYTEDIYIPASITYEGNVWPDALLRLRGDSSREYPKKSLKVQFESDPFFNGKYTVNFNADYNDLSYMHSVLSSMLFNKAGIPAPAMEHVRLYLNGVFFGLYIMTENMDEQFLEANGMDPEGILYKASLDGACLSIYDNVFYHWELNAGSDPYRDQLSGLISGLNDMDQDFIEVAQSRFNYSEITTFIAMNMLLANGSTYYHNYYLFRDNSGVSWKIFPWDLDRTFSDYAIWYLYHLSSGLWTPDNPLLERALLDATMFADIRNKVTSLSGTLVNQDLLFPVMDSIRDVIAVSVEQDTTDNIPDVMTWQNKIALDKEFIIYRDDELTYQFGHYPSPFMVDRKEGIFFPGQAVQFTWQVSEDPDNQSVSYIFYFGPDHLFEEPSTLKVEGITDHEWSMAAPDVPGKYYWMVEATDGTNVIHGFDTRNELFVSTGIPGVVINEINYNSDSAFNPGDWVEFYNTEPEAVNMGGWKFFDEDNTHAYQFTAGTSIGANDYLVLCRSVEQFYSLFPDTVPALGDLDFGFSGSGELLRLYDPIGYLADRVLYRTEYPWPEEPDGDGPTLELLNPGLDNSLGQNWAASSDHGTPGSKNGTFSPDFIGEQLLNPSGDIIVFPNPCKDILYIKSQTKVTGSVRLQIMDVHGRSVFTKVMKGDCTYELSTQDFHPGIHYGLLTFPDGQSQGFLFLKQ